ncbi:MAG: dual specificity protein phosphatase family protein [Planctomycetes bacterium]|nr:dual specificity protein phosphatase family protein [Planctomycetota bacterium]
MKSIRYSLAFLLIALAIGIAGIRAVESSVWSLSLLYPSFAFLLLGIAYGRGWPQLLGKQPDGRRSWWGIVWTAPYSLLNQLAWFLAALINREPAIGPATDRLYFGRRLTKRDTVDFDAHHFHGCLDLTAEFSELDRLRRLPGYRCLPLLDGTAPTVSQLQDAVDWLKLATDAGPVYVHCALGHGRTGTVVIAYLLACGIENDIETALARLKQSRSGVALNSGQRQLLSQFKAGLSFKEGQMTEV